MAPTLNDSGNIAIEARVRNNTGGAALTGGLLVLFGFFFLEVEAGAGISTQAANVFCYAIRLVGLALIGVAVWSSFGHLPALLGDAVVSFLAGTAFVVTAVLLLADIGWWIAVQTIVYIICGTMFMNSALRTWRDYRKLVQTRSANREITEEDIRDLAAANGASLVAEVATSRPEEHADHKPARGRRDRNELVDFEPVKRGGRRVLTTPEDQPIKLDDDPTRTLDRVNPRKKPPPHGYLAEFDK